METVPGVSIVGRGQSPWQVPLHAEHVSDLVRLEALVRGWIVSDESDRKNLNHLRNVRVRQTSQGSLDDEDRRGRQWGAPITSPCSNQLGRSDAYWR